ncbi:hypothetical protein CHARACLAT_031511 [Characodon lateralis]|uniref:Uncharacterized protein n=1 Tax=Characodon lateralis TaxID=208331 RepID=A0ABU7D294_9TELE|nr:hypothetical protein [Characodon lateralis]
MGVWTGSIEPWVACSKFLSWRFADLLSLTSDPKACSVSFESYSTDQPLSCDSASVTVVDVPAGVTQPDPTLSIVAHTDVASDILHTVDQTSTMHCDAQTQVRSRFGGLVKPLNRLIQTMSKQAVVQNKFDVKAVCKSMF